MGAELELRARGDTVTIAVRVKPRASKTCVSGVRDGALEVRVAAAPVGGAANVELCRFLARQLGVPRSQVRVKSGPNSRHKLLEVSGAQVSFVARALQADDR